MSGERQIIFIVGASRSGTTMLNRILGQNTNILALNELHFFGDLWDPYEDRVAWNYKQALKQAAILFQRIRWGIFSGNPEKAEKYCAQRIVDANSTGENELIISPAYLYRRVLESVADESNRPMVTDQTPRNIFYAERLLELYPNSKMIQIVRDPRAVLFSQRKRWTKKRHGAKSMPWSNVLRVLANYHPITIARLWRRAILSGNALSSEPRYYEIYFERLVEDPEYELGKLSSFLGVDFQKEMLDIPQMGSSHIKHDESIRGISPGYTSDWKGGLPKGDLLIMEKMTEPQMRRLGYEPVADWRYYPWILMPLLRLPFHVLGVLMTNPKRAMIQLKALFAGSNILKRQ